MPVITVGSTDIGSPSVQLGSGRTQVDSGRSVPTLRRATMNKVTTCFRLERLHTLPNQDFCGWLTRCNAAHDVLERVDEELQGDHPVDVNLADDGMVQEVGTGDIIMSMKTPRRVKRGVLTSCGTFLSCHAIFFPWGVSPRMLARSRSRKMGASRK